MVALRPTLREALLYERLRQRVMPPDALAVRQSLMGDSGPPRSGDWGRTPCSARCLTAEASTDFSWLLCIYGLVK